MKNGLTADPQTLTKDSQITGLKEDVQVKTSVRCELLVVFLIIILHQIYCCHQRSFSAVCKSVDLSCELLRLAAFTGINKVEFN